MKFEKKFKNRVEEFANALLENATLVFDVIGVSGKKVAVEIYIQNVSGQRIATIGGSAVTIVEPGDAIKIDGIQVKNIEVKQIFE